MNTGRRLSLALALSVALLGTAGPAAAQQVMYQLAVNSPAALNHWPAADALIGTGDDVVNAGPSMFSQSGPNADGSFSFNAFDFSGMGSVTDPWMPAGMIAMTFLQGTVTVDMAVAASGGGPLLSAWNVSGTEPFNGHGPYSSTLAAVNSGTYNAATGAFTLDVDFAADLNGTPDTSQAFAMSGEAWVVDIAGKRGGTGNAYVDGVLVPIAAAVGASSLVYFSGGGTVPPANNFSWGTMPVVATLVGFSPTTTSAPTETWGGIKALYR
ncbi:hypothetical protein K8I85_02435 [bacterium]|nr:hypothetical protein [bacterium]